MVLPGWIKRKEDRDEKVRGMKKTGILDNLAFPPASTTVFLGRG